jgi:Cdc6-like AAA superfamily ATPase
MGESSEDVDHNIDVDADDIDESAESDNEQRFLERRAAIRASFSPAAPISRRELFAGRTAQLKDLIDVAYEAGQHAVIYGERGVGKTSLARTLTEIFSGSQIGVLTTCDGTDNFGRIWHKVMEEIQFVQSTPGVGFGPETREVIRSAAEGLPPADEVTPTDVRRVLTALGSNTTTVVFIDEFDRLTDRPSRTLFADTMKALSDHIVPATVVLVGVADNVDELIAEHQSVERALVQIHMPRMSLGELALIVRRVEREEIGFTISNDAVDRITRLSQGLPHYTHLMTQAAAIIALEDDAEEIDTHHVGAAIRVAITKAQESVTSAYQRATFSPRTTLYREVLLACALLQGDEFGYFTAGDVREPLKAITGRPLEIPAFAAHLKDMSGARRGPILQRTGETRRFRYRFVNPLVQPYVIMRGLDEGLVTGNTLKAFLN